jgi:hypothetical protein
MKERMWIQNKEVISEFRNSKYNIYSKNIWPKSTFITTQAQKLTPNWHTGGWKEGIIHVWNQENVITDLQHKTNYDMKLKYNTSSVMHVLQNQQQSTWKCRKKKNNVTDLNLTLSYGGKWFIQMSNLRPYNQWKWNVCLFSTQVLYIELHQIRKLEEYTKAACF